MTSANSRSTWLIQDGYVGVKCMWNRGCFSIHAVTDGDLRVPSLSQITCISRCSGTVWSILARNFLNSTARSRRCVDEITVPSSTFIAANRLVVNLMDMSIRTFRA